MVKITAILKKNLDLIFFYLFILTIPLEKRHIFNLESATWDGHFFEWGSFSLYLSDIFLGLMLVFWLLRIFFLKLQVAETQKPIPYQTIRTKGLFALLFAFIAVAFLSTIRSDILSISFYHFFKICEGGLIFIYIVKNISTISTYIKSAACLVAATLFQAVLGIIQYLLQRSVGLKILGEVDLSPTIQNVAKIDVLGVKLIRAYGTMPHANLLGGFLFIGLVFTALFILILALDKGIAANVVRLGQKKTLQIAAVILCLLYLGFILSFSRSAYLALLTAPLIFVLSLIFIKREYIFKAGKVIKLFWRKYKKLSIALILFLVIATLAFIPNITSKTSLSGQADDYSIQGRMWYTELAYSMIRDNPDFGVGPGLFSFQIGDYVNLGDTVEWWQYQPVHNVFLLIGAELGITCMLLFAVFLGWIIALAFIALKKREGLNKLLLSASLIALFGLIIIMQFDHYLWTLQQGSLLFWLILGMTATASTKLRKS